MPVASVGESLVNALRPVPSVGPEDSLWRALDMLRYGGTDTVPIVDARGRLAGVITLADLRPLLLARPGDTALTEPARSRARRPAAVGHASMTAEQVRQVIATGPETSLVILDDAGKYLGIVGLPDLLAPMPVRPRPASVGGMATPWGVYLTNGSLQAGAGNRALVASGVILGMLLAAAHAAIGLSAWAVQHLTGTPVYRLWNAPQPAQIAPGNLGWFVLHALALPLFLLLLRTLPLSRYHAAEHQVVHAMERGEPLRPEVVTRMPRVHPRCGTNIMAGALLFALISQGLPALRLWGLDATDAALLGALTAMFTWRRFGAVLQHWFTTREAGPKHLASGITAAEELERKFLVAPPGRPPLRHRLWCSGMVQTFIGVTVGSSALLFLSDYLFRLLI